MQRAPLPATKMARNSFAGVFDSVLDVKEHNIAEAIETVLASFSSDRADSYQIASAGQANILVQEMVDASFAGVLFT